MASMRIVHVLVVDDDIVAATLMGRALEADGIGVEMAGNGDEALEKLSRFQPELIIADVDMPGMDGYELCRRVRAEKAGIPFFFCSGLGSERQRVHGLELGADDYLVKPIAVDELRVKVRRQLERNELLRRLRSEVEAAASPGLLAGDLSEVDLSSALQILDVRHYGEVRVAVTRGTERGEVFLSGTDIVHAEADGVEGMRALEKVLDWKTGTFRAESRPFLGEPTIGRPISGTLLRAMATFDEIDRLRGEIEGRGGGGLVVTDPAAAWTGLESDEEAVLELVRRTSGLEQLLDRSTLGSLATCRAIQGLIRKGAVGVSNG